MNNTDNTFILQATIIKICDCELNLTETNGCVATILRVCGKLDAGTITHRLVNFQNRISIQNVYYLRVDHHTVRFRCNHQSWSPEHVLNVYFFKTVLVILYTKSVDCIRTLVVLIIDSFLSLGRVNISRNIRPTRYFQGHLAFINKLCFGYSVFESLLWNIVIIEYNKIYSLHLASLTSAFCALSRFFVKALHK